VPWPKLKKKTKNMKKILVLTAVSACLLAILPVQANLVVNGNFNSGLTDWTKTSSGGGFVLSETGISGGSGGDNNANDATLTGGAAGVSAAAQLSIALTPGQEYQLTFSAYVQPPATPGVNPNDPSGYGQTANAAGILLVDQLVVDLDGAPTQTIGASQLSTATFASTYSTYNLDFTDVSSPGSLSFTWYSSDISGNGAEQQIINLDDVSLVALPPAPAPAVPEPSTYIAGALLLLPFGMSAFRSFRKNRAA
jgi:hypothetical protein